MVTLRTFLEVIPDTRAEKSEPTGLLSSDCRSGSSERLLPTGIPLESQIRSAMASLTLPGVVFTLIFRLSWCHQRAAFPLYFPLWPDANEMWAVALSMFSSWDWGAFPWMAGYSAHIQASGKHPLLLISSNRCGNSKAFPRTSVSALRHVLHAPLLALPLGFPETYRIHPDWKKASLRGDRAGDRTRTVIDSRGRRGGGDGK